MFLEKTSEQEFTLEHYKNKLIVQKYKFKSLLRLVDYATFIYLGAVALLLIIFHRGVVHWPWIICGQILLIGLFH